MNRVVVSLTTYPARIKKITRVLDSIRGQTYKPDSVVLYLSEEQFADRRLPVDLSVYFEQGLELHWCQNDMKSHKKYLYAFMEYPDDYIITVDDDFYYESHMVEELVQCIHKFPNCTLARRTHLITADENGSISEYGKWWGECAHYIGVPRMDLFATTGGGTLYSPHLINDEIFNTDNIKKYCMYADDVWLKVMELVSGVPVVQVPTRFIDTCDKEFSGDGLYQQHNKNGGNDRQMCQLLEVYEHFNGMKETLTERIFASGVVCENEVAEGIKADNFRLAEECICGACQDTEVVIYGAGIVAKRLYSFLSRHKMADKIRAFAVQDMGGHPSSIEGINVVQYRSADYENAVCIIAVADLNEQYRICRQLVSTGVQENRILFLNSKLRYALRDSMEGQSNDAAVSVCYRSGI